MEAALASGFRRLEVDVSGGLGAALGAAIAGQGETAVAELAPATGFQLSTGATLEPLQPSGVGATELILASIADPAPTAARR